MLTIGWPATSVQVGPWDTLLVVEVFDSSRARDFARAKQYARAAIPEYWIGDVNRSSVLLHQEPVGGKYTQIREHRNGQSFPSPPLGGIEVRVEQVLGPP